ncbi:hypothetical protein [Altererythrobacter sp. MF3-039]|uniref:hypothetical protein n=1 Tax=Altererythrobacter sp. MF3-039 TaxID=3252901 RepID=UPI00390C8008
MSSLNQEFPIDREVAVPAELSLELPLSPDFCRAWKTIHDKAHEVALLGQLGSERLDNRVIGFIDKAKASPAFRQALIWRAIEDISAMLAPGLSALQQIETEGRDPTAAAVTLWREFFKARSAVLDLVET